MTEDNNGMGEVALCFSSPSKAYMKKKERKQAVVFVFVFLFHIYIYIYLSFNCLTYFLPENTNKGTVS